MRLVRLAAAPLFAASVAAGCAVPAADADYRYAAVRQPAFVIVPSDIQLDEPREHEIVVVINNNAAIGNHAGLFAGTRVSDPAGNYKWVRSRTPRWTAPSLADYVKFQMEEDGKRVKVYRFEVPVSDFEAFVSRLPEADSASPLFCAAAVQNAIAGIGPFRGVEPVYWTSPAALAKRLDKLIEGGHALGTCLWADGSRCR